MDGRPSLETVARAICHQEALDFGCYVAAGAFKETYRVSKGNKPLALKVYKQGATGAREGREITALLQCDHPSIAKLERVARHRKASASYLFSLEEYLSGGTLAAWVNEHGRLDREAMVCVAQPLIDAVAHIAARRLVHRDIKPDNIMLRSNLETPVLVDFGLVRDLSQASLTHSWIAQGPGTPFFAPAEQLLNEKSLIDWRSDQFALAVSLAVSSYGAHPFGEPDYEPIAAVDNVAARGKPAEAFLEWAEQNRLEPLVRMLSAWPVERFRRPEDLAEAWKQLE